MKQVYQKGRDRITVNSTEDGYRLSVTFADFDGQRWRIYQRINEPDDMGQYASLYANSLIKRGYALAK
jgi:hypothetical protein